MLTDTGGQFLASPRSSGEGLDAAQRYSQIAPAAPHAQHVPSHIFTRVGYYADHILGNPTAIYTQVQCFRAARRGKFFWKVILRCGRPSC